MNEIRKYLREHREKNRKEVKTYEEIEIDLKEEASKGQKKESFRVKASTKAEINQKLYQNVLSFFFFDNAI